MQVTDQTIVTAGAAGGVLAFAAGTAHGIRNAGHRYAEADQHVRSFRHPDAGPTSYADAKRMARSSGSARAGADAIVDVTKQFNLDTPGMRSATAISTGARRGAVAGAVILAGTLLATPFIGD